jgi:hypothetical protein
MNYQPGPLPSDPKQLIEYLSRELRRISTAVQDDTAMVQYRTSPASQGSLTAAVSANYKIAQGNLIRISASSTVTLTGLSAKASQSRTRVDQCRHCRGDTQERSGRILGQLSIRPGQ